MEDETIAVCLHIYDLTRGMAQLMSAAILGRRLCSFTCCVKPVSLTCFAYIFKGNKLMEFGTLELLSTGENISLVEKESPVAYQLVFFFSLNDCFGCYTSNQLYIIKLYITRNLIIDFILKTYGMCEKNI